HPHRRGLAPSGEGAGRGRAAGRAHAGRPPRPHAGAYLHADGALRGGGRGEAVAAAREATGYMHPEMLRQMPGYDFTLVYPQWVLLRFGGWDEALAEPSPPDDLLFAKAM